MSLNELTYSRRILHEYEGNIFESELSFSSEEVANEVANSSSVVVHSLAGFTNFVLVKYVNLNGKDVSVFAKTDTENFLSVGETGQGISAEGFVDEPSLEEMQHETLSDDIEKLQEDIVSVEDLPFPEVEEVEIDLDEDYVDSAIVDTEFAASEVLESSLDGVSDEFSPFESSVLTFETDEDVLEEINESKEDNKFAFPEGSVSFTEWVEWEHSEKERLKDKQRFTAKSMLAFSMAVIPLVAWYLTIDFWNMSITTSSMMVSFVFLTLVYSAMVLLSGTKFVKKGSVSEEDLEIVRTSVLFVTLAHVGLSALKMFSITKGTYFEIELGSFESSVILGLYTVIMMATTHVNAKKPIKEFKTEEGFISGVDDFN